MSKINIRIIITSLFTALVLVPALGFAQPSDPKEIVSLANDKSDFIENDKVKDILATIEITRFHKNRLIDQNQIRLKMLDEEKIRKVVARYELPEDIKGMAYLFHEIREGDKKDSIWLYMPALNKVRRITLREAANSLPGIESRMGLSGAVDLGDEDDYDYRTMSDEEIDGVLCHVIEVTPKSWADPRLTKRKVWIEKQRNLVVKVEKYSNIADEVEEIAYETEETATKVEETATFKDYQQHLENWLPRSTKSENLPKQERIEIKIISFKVNNGLKDKDFDVNLLQKAF